MGICLCLKKEKYHKETPELLHILRVNKNNAVVSIFLKNTIVKQAGFQERKRTCLGGFNDCV